MINTGYADEYMARHLDAALWNAMTPDKKNACLSMAEYDVCAKLGIDTIDEESVNMLNAVYEQALYLGINYERIKQPVQVSSESLDGVGNRSYKIASGMEFSPRAQMFIRRISGGNFFSRG
ncbi:MAG: hypothetical protein JXR78_14425 [Victivallales bacterium]|nr:hypothetical protein [Victivallales bacterium]